MANDMSREETNRSMAGDDEASSAKPLIPDYARASSSNSSADSLLSHPRRVQIGTGVGLLATFGIPVVIAGHGIAPIGLIIIFGDWGLPTSALLVGALFLFAGLIPEGATLVRFLDLVGIVIVCTSWILFVRGSENLAITLLTSLPFVAALVLKIIAVATLRRACG